VPGATSPWRLNDVVAYDRLREAVMTLTQMQVRARAGLDEREWLARLRSEVLLVDAFDRSAVNALTNRVEELMRDLERSGVGRG
jgi:hypothetical protein